ncbi:MAG: hypothetical protein HY544_00110 [Candidatus Diapherotrites archaeon]|uniref:Uncharacterized protein n=1 Tax=Candidatus Iainarchaeum sp. TaxID=3101447 RepID=A0A8T3YJQ7_9ARCH|nr:hypothetical protein [Candidatus Diapherotrites archaeon]
MLKSAIAMAAIFITVAVSGCTLPWETAPEDYHMHADFKVILEGKAMDLNKAEYMSDEYKELSHDAHMHDFNPNVIHFHSRDATLGEFFKSIGMGLTGDCFSDGKADYCSGANGKLAMYVNGAPATEYGDYRPRDLDKILIYYGEGTPTKEMLDSITSESCIYSKKCPMPQGFNLPAENCTAGKPCSIYDTA